MPSSTAHVATSRPSRYIKQLISHMDHKATAELAGDGRGTITFGRGTCVLTPSGDHLDMIATAGDVEALSGVQDVVTRHLLRFATQEELSVDWTAPVAGESMQIIDPSSATTCSHTARRPTICSRSWSSKRGRPPATRQECRSPTTRAPS